MVKQGVRAQATDRLKKSLSRIRCKISAIKSCLFCCCYKSEMADKMRSNPFSYNCLVCFLFSFQMTSGTWQANPFYFGLWPMLIQILILAMV